MHKSLLRVIVTVALSTVCVAEVIAEEYVVPIWAQGLSASDGEWWAQTVVSNPHGFAVTFQVPRVFPLITRECPECDGKPADVMTLAPYGWTIVEPHSQPGRLVTAGAFEVHSSATLNISVVAYRLARTGIRQRIEVARGWLNPGMHTISSVEYAPEGVRLNALIVNPSETPLPVSVWVTDRAENEVRAMIPPSSMRIIQLPPLVGSFPAPFPPFPLRVHVESGGVFLAAVSSVSNDWAVFSLADEAAAR